MQVRTVLGALLLLSAGGLSAADALPPVPPPVVSQPPAAPDMAAMATAYTKALGFAAAPVCSTAAVDGNQYSCTVMDATQLFSGPFTFLCGPDAGCFVPLPALALPVSPTK